jgi:hypothetical protein
MQVSPGEAVILYPLADNELSKNEHFAKLLFSNLQARAIDATIRAPKR